MKRPLFTVGATILFALNALCKYGIKTAWVTSIVALAVFVFLMFSERQRASGVLPTVALTLAVCSLYFAVYSVNVNKRIMPLVSEEFSVHSVSGEVVSLPYSDNGRYYYVIKTDEIDGVKISTKIRLTLNNKLDAEPFDRVEGELPLFELGSYSDEMTDYYRSKNLYIGAAAGDGKGLSFTKCDGFHPMYYILKLKAAVINAIETNLPDEYGGLLTGFLLGEKSFISSKTLNAFSLIGSIHLLAVSGLHVSVWAAFVYSFFRAIGIKKRWRSALIIAFVLVFEALTGFNPPVLRAGTMLFFIGLGNIGKREADSLNSIGLAVAVMLFINPFAASSGSLWLSAFASCGIILTARPIFNKLNFVSFGAKPLEAVKNRVLEALSVTLAVTVFTLPLTVILFDRFSFIVPLSNLVLIPLASFAMIISGVAVLLFLIGLNFVSYPLLLISSGLARVITDFSIRLSDFKNITVSTTFIPLRIAAFTLIVFAVIMIILKNKGIKLHIKRIMCVAAVLFCAVIVCGIVNEKTAVRVYLAGIDNGMSVTVCDNNSICLLGCGLNDFSSYEICDIMKKEGAQSVDFALIPSNESRARSAIPYIEKQYPIDSIAVDRKGTVILQNGAKLFCNGDTAIYESEKIKILTVFDGDGDFENADADFIFTKDGIYSRDGLLLAENGETLLLEVKQNGRARVKATN